MQTLDIHRTKRPRDSYKVVDEAQRIVFRVELQSSRMFDSDGKWYVAFRNVMGVRRTLLTRIGPFHDMDVATALLLWNIEHGGDPAALAIGYRFITRSQEDALMVHMAFR